MFLFESFNIPSKGVALCSFRRLFCCSFSTPHRITPFTSKIRDSSESTSKITPRPLVQPYLVIQLMIITFLAILSQLYQSGHSEMSGNKERTFIMIKPDGVQRGIVGDIIKRFEAKGFKLVAMKFKQVINEC